jgi:hypothetical protein
MKNLNESIDRIKGMMKMIQESDFSVMDQLPNKEPDQNQWDLKSIIMYVMASFDGPPDFDAYDINSEDGFFTIIDTEYKYELRYEFDLKIISAGYYRPGTYDDPPESEGPEYDFINMKLTITDIEDGNENVIYSGEDFSDFPSMKFAGNERRGPVSGAGIMYSYFDDAVNEIIGDNEPDESDYYYDRD